MTMLSISIHNIADLSASAHSDHGVHWVWATFRSSPSFIDSTRKEQQVTLFFETKLAAERCAAALNSIYDPPVAGEAGTLVSTDEVMP